MTPREVLLSLTVALAAGLLVGAEREQAHTKTDFGGVRTFPLIALLGAIGALLGHGVVLAVLLFGVIALLGISHVRKSHDDPGVTSEVAAIVTFALGALAGSVELLPSPERLLLVVGLAAVTMALLAVKHPLHGFIARVSRDDIYATAKFVVLALVALPLLPNRTFGPLDVLNPFKIGLFIVLVAGVSFAGYVAARLVGSRRGLLLVGLIGGLVSSTAVTVTLSRRAKEHPTLVRACTVAIVAACSTMFARVLVMVGIVDLPLLSALGPPLGAMACAGFGIAVVMGRGEGAREKAAEAVPLRNPFELTSALAFGLLYALILFVAKAAKEYVGSTGLYASSIVAGLADVDAITLSLTELHRSGTSSAVATGGIVLAVGTNTLVKAAISALAGGKALGLRIALTMLLLLAVGGAGIALGSLASNE